jgi:hypothetical protein
VYDKLGVADRLELALYCLNHRVAQKEPVEKVTATADAVTQVPETTSTAPSAAAAAASGSRT